MITKHINNIILPRNIRSLSGLKFYIPDYQRGYRWTDTQAKQMLHDFIDFIEAGRENSSDAEGYYCLQPVVVKPKEWVNKEGFIEEGYEVIDGQQRLTTLFLLLQALFHKDEKNRTRSKGFKMFSIDYQTRGDSQKFLEKITDDSYRTENQYECIDFYHINMVYNAFVEELDTCEDMDCDRDLTSMVLNEKIVKEDEDGDTPEIDKARNVRLIWYEIGEGEQASSEDIFTRLNIGKIPLTNAELIKAMFLKESNFGRVTAMKDKEREAQMLGIALQQTKIAEDWNIIEQKLHRNDFWYFLGGESMGKEYETRIEFIFDLIAEWNNDVETYHTFNEFQRRIKSFRKKPAENVWKEVKDYFRDLEYWYSDRKLYHLIGFLIQCGKTIGDIKKLEFTTIIIDGKEVSIKLKKDQFVEKVEAEIKTIMEDVNIDSLKYPDPNITRVLLLFNILSVIDSERSDIKFPFDKYKKENWDKEHIASQTDKDSPEVPSKKSKRIAWINDMLFYFTGKKEKEDKHEDGTPFTSGEKAGTLLDEVKAYLDGYIGVPEMARECEIIKSLIDVKELSLLGSKEISAEEKQRYDETMKTLFMTLRYYFNDDRIAEDDKYGLGNMALLNSSINRSYGNAFFAIKRMHIQENDSEGVFIPLATKNVFMKYYSKRVNGMLTWSNDDAMSYLGAIKTRLKKFIKSEENGKQ